MSLLDLYGDTLKIYTSGYNFILGRFYGIVNLAMLASTYLIVQGYEIDFLTTTLVGIVAIIVIMITGYVYLKLGLVKAESKSNFVENPQNMEMLTRIRRIEEILIKLENDNK